MGEVRVWTQEQLRERLERQRRHMNEDRTKAKRRGRHVWPRVPSVAIKTLKGISVAPGLLSSYGVTSRSSGLPSTTGQKPQSGSSQTKKN